MSKIETPKPVEKHATRQVQVQVRGVVTFAGSLRQQTWEDTGLKMALAGIHVWRMTANDLDFAEYEESSKGRERLVLIGSPDKTETVTVNRQWTVNGDFEIRGAPDVARGCVLIEGVSGPVPRDLGRLEAGAIAETAFRCAAAYARARGRDIGNAPPPMEVLVPDVIAMVESLSNGRPSPSWVRESFIKILAPRLGNDTVAARVFVETACGMIRAELDLE